MEQRALKVLIVYYSRTGNTEAMAKAIAEGVKSEGLEAEVKRVDRTTTHDVMSADAIAFGSPCYFGYMAGVLKDFFDRLLLEALLKNLKGKPAAAFASNGETNGGRDALSSIEKMVVYFMFEKVATGVVSKGKPERAKLEECKNLGIALARAAKKRKPQS